MSKRRASRPRERITQETTTPDSGPCVCIGDIVMRKPISFSEGDAKNASLMRGKVVWIHPKGRFHVVEFENGIRESFHGVRK